jgi:PTH1 family peptidyl-tRNA hydrolase
MGIGHPGDKNKVSGYVLKDFSKSEQPWLDNVLYGIEKHSELLLEGSDDFMTRMAEIVK